ncbi:hypothetical protein [Rubinisphaera italica]|uniref:Uncharacterized protein n=1 Tax=Rubinisphaera italica TaxID=2527969 RepID=A0A5C5XCG9_9PLAN|nr:hypothetical protein [Rubinisphaera italica]TWT59865.1 hypothetical protein Pan54_05760 [Rubinisphaera italica]
MISRNDISGQLQWVFFIASLLLVISLVGLNGRCSAQSPELTSQSIPEVATSEATPAGTSAAIALSPEEREKRDKGKQMLPVFWILLIGIAILGGLLVLMAIYLGSHARRIARKPSPSAKLKNEYWYLQKRETPEQELGIPPQKDETE